MLTLKKCRELLGRNCTLSDSKLELLRDQMHGFADIIYNLLVVDKIYLLLYSPFDLVITEEFVSVVIVEV